LVDDGFASMHIAFLPPTDFPEWLADNMYIERFDFIDDAGALHMREDYRLLPPLDYGCGIYTFRKSPKPTA